MEIDEEESAGDNDEDTGDNGERLLPKRVLVFTSKKLLKLFEDNDGKSSVDGTFKAVLWKQMFVWMTRFGGFWLPVCWGWLPDKSLQSYKVFFHLVLEELKRRNIPLNTKELISDFELHILKSADEMLLGIVILGCFFHLSKAIWKKVQVSGFATQFAEQADFHKFVKSTLTLAHLPLEDIEKGMDYLKSFELSDEDCSKFKEEIFIPYIQKTWIGGPYPPNVWNCYGRSGR